MDGAACIPKMPPVRPRVEVSVTVQNSSVSFCKSSSGIVAALSFSSFPLHAAEGLSLKKSSQEITLLASQGVLEIPYTSLGISTGRSVSALVLVHVHAEA